MSPSPETSLLVAWLKNNTKVGDVATIKDMSHACNVDLHRRRWILTSALNILQRDYQIVFKSVPKCGYKRVEPSEIPMMEAHFRTSRIRGHTRRWRDRVVEAGQSTTMAGMQSLAQCSFVDAAVDVQVQQAVARHARKRNAIDIEGRRSQLLHLFDE